VFWIIVVDATIIENTSKCPKIPKENSQIHTNILCSHIKVLNKKITFCGLRKNTKKRLMNSPIEALTIVFLHKPQKMFFLTFQNM
jgi:hypothetical protein